MASSWIKEIEAGSASDSEPAPTIGAGSPPPAGEGEGPHLAGDAADVLQELEHDLLLPDDPAPRRAVAKGAGRPVRGCPRAAHPPRFGTYSCALVPSSP